ncbi:hypothetical protein C4546_00980 [Candidatus Parcubacteria bacterium]|jgi:O-antigen ligase|nr:MAG: hypothetical protein C4546_00980 [Candidatus Parcubacteria bacterium]
MSILAISLGVLILFFAWRKPVWVGLFVLLLLPTYQLRFEVFGLPTTVLEFLVWFSVAGLILALGLKKISWPKLSNWHWLATVIWLGVGLFGVWVSGDHYQALGLYRAYFLEPILLMPWLVIIAQSETNRRLVLLVFSLQILILGFMALGQRFGLFVSPSPWILENPPRVSGWFAFPNALALYVAPLSAFLFGAWLKLRSIKSWPETPLWIISAFFGFLACLLANSQGALIGLAAVLVSAGFFVKRKRLWFGVVVIVCAALLFIPIVRQKSLEIVTGADVSTDVRRVLWQGTWRLLQARPITGAGLGNFPEVYKVYKLPQHVEFLQYPHNLILNVWSEVGLPGLVFSLIAVIWLSIRLFQAVRNQNHWAMAGVFAWLALVVHGLVDVPFFKNDLAILTLGLFIFAVFLPPGDKAKNKIPS